MNITFLGGANEIGASCAIVEIGQGRVLIDCGIRMSGEDRLPELAAIRNSSHLTHLDAVLLTHAHTDHTGALPILHSHFPGVPIYCTAATRSIAEILLRDALNIQQKRREQEGELPMFAAGAVDSLVENLIPVPFGAPQSIGRTGLVATWTPSGHILGAGSISLEGVEASRSVRVVFSGDVSVTDQLTVPGILLPRNGGGKGRPDVLVIESTYGDGLHTARSSEERRLLELIAGVIERGGKLLIPAFAVGRAQEVLLILVREFRRKSLRPFPVYVDGMVRKVCAVYKSHPAHQTAFARRLIERHGDPFFGAVDEIRAVSNPNERDKVLSGEPCVIVASSGMLTGGASAYYAEKLIADERNAIALTGYQDEESPGRRLLDLAEGKVGHLDIGGRTHEVKAQASKYSLSAHGDANEIISVIEALDPRHVVLVHGEGRARPALAELINRNSRRNRVVHLPRTGETLHFGATRRALYPQQRVHIGFGGGEDLTDEGLHKLAGELRRQGEERRAFSEIDLLDAWFGQGSWTEAQYEEIVRALDGTKAFRPHPSRPHLYRLPRPDAGEPDATPAMFYAEPNELLHRIETALPKDAGLYRKGYDLANHEVRLWFSFPIIARERFRETLKKLLAGTGWTYSVNEQPHQIKLAEAATEVFPEAIRALLQTPAIRLDTSEVIIKAVASIHRATCDEAARKFSETTGFTLRVLAPDEVRLEGDSSSETPAKFVDESQLSVAVPLEINLTYKTIDEAFQQQPETWRPSRKSLKTEGVNTYIELAFISPQTGLRQAALIAELARRIGREIRIKPEPNQIALSELAARMIPSEWHLLKTPSVHKAQSEISVRLARAPLTTDERWTNMANEFYEQTGYRLTQS